MEKFYKGQAEEHWQKLVEACYVIGYLKGELRSKGYTSEQLDKLEQDARDYHRKLKG